MMDGGLHLHHGIIIPKFYKILRNINKNKKIIQTKPKKSYTMSIYDTVYCAYSVLCSVNTLITFLVT